MESESKLPVTPNQSPQVSPLVKEFPKKSGGLNLKLVVLVVLVVFAGVALGWFLSGKPFSKGSGSKNGAAPGAVNEATEAGLEDTKNFPDTAEGILTEGGIEGEGSYHLVRDGGPSKYVYLTSTVVDLQKFVGKKVDVWGQTMAGKKAPWLMDVGRIKVVE